MIPAFDERGYLPPGVHAATIEEVATRFGLESELRRTQMESIRWLVAIARRAGIARLVLNGSFVTDIYEPNDVDCVLILGPDTTRDAAAAAELIAGLPFLQIDLVEHQDFEIMIEVVFASDRAAIPKGMIEVPLWD